MVGWRSVFVGLAALLCMSYPTAAQAETYGERLCKTSGFSCYTVKVQMREVLVKKNPQTKKKVRVLDSWQSLWPDPVAREAVMKLNRLNIDLEKGMVLAVPNDLNGKTFMDFSPYALTIAASKEKLLIWDPQLLAWAAYDKDGKLLRWGPGVGGKDYCPDVGRSCHTVTGVFHVGYKGGPNAHSTRYPIGCWGSSCAPMPYYMEFHPAGYGFHGSKYLPGENASHGCVRLYTADAKWLDNNFIEIGTKVLIRPYKSR